MVPAFLLQSNVSQINGPFNGHKVHRTAQKVQKISEMQLVVGDNNDCARDEKGTEPVLITPLRGATKRKLQSVDEVVHDSSTEKTKKEQSNISHHVVTITKKPKRAKLRIAITEAENVENTDVSSVSPEEEMICEESSDSVISISDFTAVSDSNKIEEYDPSYILQNDDTSSQITSVRDLITIQHKEETVSDNIVKPMIEIKHKKESRNTSVEDSIIQNGYNIPSGVLKPTVIETETFKYLEYDVPSIDSEVEVPSIPNEEILSEQIQHKAKYSSLITLFALLSFIIGSTFLLLPSQQIRELVVTARSQVQSSNIWLAGIALGKVRFKITSASALSDHNSEEWEDGSALSNGSEILSVQHEEDGEGSSSSQVESVRPHDIEGTKEDVAEIDSKVNEDPVFISVTRLDKRDVSDSLNQMAEADIRTIQQDTPDTNDAILNSANSSSSDGSDSIEAGSVGMVADIVSEHLKVSEVDVLHHEGAAGSPTETTAEEVDVSVKDQNKIQVDISEDSFETGEAKAGSLTETTAEVEDASLKDQNIIQDDNNEGSFQAGEANAGSLTETTAELDDVSVKDQNKIQVDISEDSFETGEAKAGSLTETTAEVEDPSAKHQNVIQDDNNECSFQTDESKADIVGELIEPPEGEELTGVNGASVSERTPLESSDKSSNGEPDFVPASSEEPSSNGDGDLLAVVAVAGEGQPESDVSIATVNEEEGIALEDARDPSLQGESLTGDESLADIEAAVMDPMGSSIDAAEAADSPPSGTSDTTEVTSSDSDDHQESDTVSEEKANIVEPVPASVSSDTGSEESHSERPEIITGDDTNLSDANQEENDAISSDDEKSTVTKSAESTERVIATDSSSALNDDPSISLLTPTEPEEAVDNPPLVSATPPLAVESDKEILDYAVFPRGGQVITPNSKAFDGTILTSKALKGNGLLDQKSSEKGKLGNVAGLFKNLLKKKSLSDPSILISSKALKYGSCFYVNVGKSSNVTISVHSPIYLHSIVLKHVLLAAVDGGFEQEGRSCAPKDVVITGWTSDPRKKPAFQSIKNCTVNLGSHQLTWLSTPTDKLDLLQRSSEVVFEEHLSIPLAGIPLQAVTFTLLSNHGHDRFGCLYRVQLHGKLAIP